MLKTMMNTHDSKTLNAVNRMYESTIKHYFFSGYYQLAVVIVMLKEQVGIVDCCFITGQHLKETRIGNDRKLPCTEIQQ